MKIYFRSLYPKTEGPKTFKKEKSLVPESSFLKHFVMTG